MSAYPLPDNEAERQRQLDSFQILDAEPDEDFDRIIRIASQMLGMPIALISLVDLPPPVPLPEGGNVLILCRPLS